MPDNKKNQSPIIKKLRVQESVSFEEIRKAIGGDEKEPYSELEVLHHLLRALWRGKFEDEKGQSRLWIPSTERGLTVGINQVFYQDQHKNIAPPIKEFLNRRCLFNHLNSTIAHIYNIPTSWFEDKIP